MRKGMNSTEMQRSNRLQVFQTLLENGSMMRAELAALLGLQKATITNIINEFFELGIAAVDGDAASGRRGERICLKVDGLYTMSIGITRSDCQVAVFDLQGKQRRHVRLPFTRRGALSESLEQLEKLAVDLLNEFGNEKILAICLAVPGPFIRNEIEGVEVFNVTHFDELNHMDIRRELEGALGRSIFIKHDAKLSALAEWRNAAEVKDNSRASLMVIRSRGFGVGAGMIINGTTVEGQMGIAGEIGHNGIYYNRYGDGTNRTDTLEYCAGTESAIRYVRERLFEFPESPLSEESSYAQILDAYYKGDALAVWAMSKLAWLLAYGIVNIIYVINPDCIIIGPDYPEHGPFFDKLREVIGQSVPRQAAERMVIRNSLLEADSFLLGGHYYCMDRICRENRLIETIQEALGK